mmetsp:Transcript_16474/g.30155  ORF Transcript_16474/g.30155 Transcript_16474/m.30155 type:complete len:423 (+) Transcript_16474:307-1575(+)
MLPVEPTNRKPTEIQARRDQSETESSTSSAAVTSYDGETAVELSSYKPDDTKESVESPKTNLVAVPLDAPGHNASQNASPKKTSGLVTRMVCCSEESQSVVTCFAVSVGAVFGALVRFGLTKPDSDFSTSFLLSNFLGTATLSLLSLVPELFSNDSKFVNVGIGTGFCGALTTFSTWQLAAAQSAILVTNPSSLMQNSRSTRAFLWAQVEIIGMATNAAGWHFGSHLRYFVCCAWLDKRPRDQTNRAPKFGKIATSMSKGGMVYFTYAITTVVISSITSLVVFQPSTLSWTLCWAPLGAVLRWRLGVLNGLLKNFPVGTFTANLLASGLAAGIVALTQSGSTLSFELNCDLVRGFTYGFCGALSTVSTFMKELSKLELNCAYKYASISIIGAQLLSLSLLFALTTSEYRLGSTSTREDFCKL